MTRRRAPDPMTPLYAPAAWRANAFFNGRKIDLVSAFRWRPYRDLGRIEIRLSDGKNFYPFREIDLHAGMPYPENGPGTMTRAVLRDRGMTDAQLEREVRRRFGVRLRLAGGRDTPRKRCQRFEAHRLILDAITNEEK